MRLRRTWLGLLLALAMAGVQAQDGGLVLAQHGDTQARIRLPAEADETVMLAAKELSLFLSEATGALFPVDSSGNGDPLIDLRLDGEEGLGREGYRLRIDADGVTISARGGRGLLNGVYGLLQDHVGVRWYAPDHTDVPQHEVLRLPFVDDSHRPAFAYREVFMAEADDATFAARNRLNGRFSHRVAQDGGVPGAFMPLHKLHVYQLVPKAEYRQSHPEYYGGGQLQFANDEVRRIAIEAVREALASLPAGPKLLLIEHVDRDSYHSGGGDAALIKRFASPGAAYVDFVRAIALAVRDEYPEVTVLSQAYKWSRQPPTGIALPDNMGVMFSLIERDFAKPLESKAHVDLVTDLNGWSKLTDRIYVWHYAVNFAAYPQPYPSHHTMAADAATLATAPGVRGVFVQGAYHTVGGAFAPMRIWLWSRLLWDPAAPMDKLRDDYLKGYFGPAAPFIAEYLDSLEVAAKDMTQPLRHSMPPEVAYLDEAFLKRADDLFDEAEAAVASADIYLRHVRHARTSVDYAILSSIADMTDDAWVNQASRLDRLETSLRDMGATAFREGTGFTLATLVERLSIERHPAPRPGPCSSVPAQDCRVRQELAFDLADDARLAPNEQASNGAAAVMPGHSSAWGIQLPLDRLLPTEGSWRVYVRIGASTDALPANEPAMQLGIYPGVKLALTEAELPDRGFIWYELPQSWDLSRDRYIWFAPAGGDGVRSIMVDRIMAIREDSP